LSPISGVQGEFGVLCLEDLSSAHSAGVHSRSQSVVLPQTDRRPGRSVVSVGFAV